MAEGKMDEAKCKTLPHRALAGSQNTRHWQASSVGNFNFVLPNFEDSTYLLMRLRLGTLSQAKEASILDLGGWRWQNHQKSHGMRRAPSQPL